MHCTYISSSITHIFNQSFHCNYVVINKEICPLRDCKIFSRLFDYDGGELIIKQHAVKLTVPTGAIDKGYKVQLEAATSLFGPFIIPEGYYPISPYVWIGACYEFMKKLVVEIEHDIFVSEESMPELCILTACEKDVYGKEKLLKLHKDNCDYHYEVNNSTCTFFANSFCSKCLAVKGDVKPPKRIRVYHHVPIDYTSKIEFIAEVCFCYDLYMCKQVIPCLITAYVH